MAVPKKVIVSGVSGQDGSYMVDHLLATTDHLVYGMVRRTAKPDYSNLAQALNNPRFTLVNGDLSDTGSIERLVIQIKPDYFINLACQSYVGSSWDLAEMTVDVGALGVIRVLEAVRKHAPQCRVFSAGSSEQWGNVIYSPQDEKHPMRPRSPYGVAKCAAGLACKVWRESYGMYVVHGLSLNHESPRRGPEFLTRKVTLGIARIVASLKARQPYAPIELGNLDAKRDWSHAKDFVEGIWLMLNQDEPREYVLASGETHSIREFVELAFKEARVFGDVFGWHPTDDPLKQAYMWDYQNTPLVVVNPSFYRPADVQLLLGDPSRARAELGWSPKVTFPELVREMVHHDLAAVGL